jgi:hypothetical protein
VVATSNRRRYVLSEVPKRFPVLDDRLRRAVVFAHADPVEDAACDPDVGIVGIDPDERLHRERTSGVSLDALKSEGFSKDVLDAIDSLTRRSGETYETFVLRAAENPIGLRVKLADLEDNSDVSRIHRPTSRDYARVEKYRRAIEAIRAVDHENGYREPDTGQ